MSHFKQILMKIKRKLDYLWERERNIMIILMILPLIFLLIGFPLVYLYSSNQTVLFIGWIFIFAGFSSLGLTILLGTYLGLSRIVFAPWWSRDKKSKVIRWAREVRQTAEVLDQERAKYSEKAAREFMEKIQSEIRKEKIKMETF